MLTLSLKYCIAGITARYRLDDNLFNLRRKQVRIKIQFQAISEMVFQLLERKLTVEQFVAACNIYGMTLPISKTEVL